MLKHIKLFLILITLLYLPLQSFGQNPQIAITPTQNLQNAQVLYFSNFDIFNVGNAQYLFDLSIVNIEPGTAADNTAHLEIEFYLWLSYGEQARHAGNSSMLMTLLMPVYS